MKFVICAIALLVGVQALTQEQMQLAMNHHKECLAESHVDPTMIVRAIKGDFSEDPAFKEHIYCFSKKVGFQNAAGEVQPDVIRAMLGTQVQNAEKVNEIMSKCLTQRDTPQETAFQTVKCYYGYTHSGSA